MLKCSGQTVRRLAHEHKLSAWRLNDGGWIRLDRASVERYMANRFKANLHGQNLKSKKNGK